MEAAKSAMKRTRTSVACISCRERRTRCVIAPGHTECGNCRRNRVKCVYREDDESKRPICKAYVKFLVSRVELLESVLERKGESVPSSAQSPSAKTSKFGDHTVAREEDMPNKTTRSPKSSQPPMVSYKQRQADTAQKLVLPMEQITHHLPLLSPKLSTSPHSTVPGPSKELIDCILSPNGHLIYNEMNRQTRYYGPTTNIHVYSDLVHDTASVDSRALNKHAARVIRDLPQKTHNYLMDLYWTHYNTVVHIVHKQSFDRDRENGGTQHYSEFLHICLLAMGFRFADKTKPELQNIILGSRESTLHREAKYLFEYELDKSRNLPVVQASLVLGDLECGLARDNTGWMYADIACRLALELGLNRDCARLNIQEEEVQIRRMVFLACIIYDEYWALWLGRQNSIRLSDLDMAGLTNQRASLRKLLPSGPDNTLDTLIYSSLLELMEHAKEITENIGSFSKSKDLSAYFSMSAIDRKLRKWYRSLPPRLRWIPENAETAPLSYFLLHQQFHTLLIMVHRPFAQYGPCGSIVNDGNTKSDASIEDEAFKPLNTVSRATCFENALRIASILEFIQRRFNTRQMFITGIQHAGTAATTLIAAISLMKYSTERAYPLQRLQILLQVLKNMACTYKPAERMLTVLEQVTQDFGWNLDILTDVGIDHPTHVGVESRKASDLKSHQVLKKQQTSYINRSVRNLPTPLSDLIDEAQPAETFAPDGYFDCFDYNSAAPVVETQTEIMSQMTPVSLDDQIIAEGKYYGMDLGLFDDSMLFST